jgi:hypothetical protein
MMHELRALKHFLRRPFREQWWNAGPDTFVLAAFLILLLGVLTLLYMASVSLLLTGALLAILLLWWHATPD